MGKRYKKANNKHAGYHKRSRMRKKQLIKGTLNLVGYFMLAQSLDETTAKNQMNQLSYECRDLLFLYELGNTQPLINAVNASSLPFMDAAAKAAAEAQLTIS